MNPSRHYLATLVVAIVIVSAFTASSGAQKYSDWSAPINLGSTLNSGPQNVQPYISSDGETLFFASNRPGGLGSQVVLDQQTFI